MTASGGARRAFRGAFAAARRNALLGWELGLGIHGFVVFVRLHGDGLRGMLLRRGMERLRRRG